MKLTISMKMEKTRMIQEKNDLNNEKEVILLLFINFYIFLSNKIFGN
jgi:hypothetical protein